MGAGRDRRQGDGVIEQGAAAAEGPRDLNRAPDASRERAWISDSAKSSSSCGRWREASSRRPPVREQIRAAMETPLGYDREGRGSRSRSELGWACVHIPEEYGGLGPRTTSTSWSCSRRRARRCSARPSSRPWRSAPTRSCWSAKRGPEGRALPAIAEGSYTATLAFSEASGRWDAGGHRGHRDAATATGSSSTARNPGSSTATPRTACWSWRARPERPARTASPSSWSTGDAAGISRKALPTMDQTRRLAQIDVIGGARRGLRVSGRARRGLARRCGSTSRSRGDRPGRRAGRRRPALSRHGGRIRQGVESSSADPSARSRPSSTNART